MTGATPYTVPLPDESEGYACPWKIRTKFNEALAFCRQQRFPFNVRVGRPRPPRVGVMLPDDRAQSVIRTWLNPQGVVMAETHQYVRGRQRLASGREDPTKINYRGVVLERGHPDAVRCPDCDEWRPKAEASAQRLP